MKNLKVTIETIATKELSTVAESEKNYCFVWQNKYPHHIENFSVEELSSKGIDEIYFINLTTVDVKELGFEVLKVITPKMHLLTRYFKYSYLGLFNSNIDLFIEYPHPLL